MESQAAEGRIWLHNLGQLLGEEPTLLNVEIKARPLETSASSRPTGRGHTSATIENLEHDYVVITALGKDGTEVAFMVEKLPKTQRALHGKTDAGIRSDDRAGTLHINIEVGSWDRGNSTSRYSKNLGSKKIPITDLIAILAANGEKYSLAKRNCHEYAHCVTENLAEASPSLADAERVYCCIPRQCVTL